MKKTLCAMIALVILTVSCNRSEITREEENLLNNALNSPAHQMKFYNFDPTVPLSGRFSLPAVVLDFVKQYDSRPDYTLYELTDAEKAIVMAAIDKLSAPMKKALEEHVVGVIFINGFLGSGMTDFIYDDSGNMYNYFVFNPATLKMNLSDWLTYKEKTCFIDQPGYDIRVTATTNMVAFPYIIAHETLHLFDFYNEVTPFVEPFNSIYMRSRGVNPPAWTDFTKGYWESYNKPVDEYGFGLRNKISFYGFGGPNFREMDAAYLYRKLNERPFASLYACMNWAEDAAELFAFTHLKRVYGAEVTFTCLSNGMETARYAPMDNPLVTNRIPVLDKMIAQ